MIEVLKELQGIHKAARPGLLQECQRLSSCDCKVTLGYKLSANYVLC